MWAGRPTETPESSKGYNGRQQHGCPKCTLEKRTRAWARAHNQCGWGTPGCRLGPNLCGGSMSAPSGLLLSSLETIWVCRGGTPVAEQLY